ncbi:C4-dicarboxylate ABC transporter permease [Aneurinibacillus migulanus]|uniref:C4-dicarboxylate ABC transporter permease n=1 Tax=Aneurinibacillus migulanus TaxID=47500 RepID=A0A0M0GXR3_ANEMI|nr:TRAP transporter small permease [Aneurinibacillus migulanus]KON94765.1 C4-dicarboxylate ABC transporter permease [Aneurinibacillus migulanus]KPD08365.1 C4-dicarboxylate ABC transporter permease [Aneurinibacillus migulanus]MCP1354696.1 TRAP transporter small permease [Aneurinibacillus migulanus]MED0894695.1 TRAP transporter small permease [Aneurinibacillus migulanus]MED1615183.1 TRAP transporter small permease [Aneurinibacillus migulanus]
MKSLRKAWDLFEDIAAGTFLSVGIALIFYGVMMRYAFNEPKAWVEEVANYTIVWGALLGVPVALRNNHHIQVDMVYDKLPRGAQRAVDIFASVMGVLFCIFFTYYGYVLVAKRYVSGMVSMDVGIPMWLVYLILPISGIMFFFRFLEKLVQALRGEKIVNTVDMVELPKEKEDAPHGPHAI